MSTKDKVKYAIIYRLRHKTKKFKGIRANKYKTHFGGFIYIHISNKSKYFTWRRKIKEQKEQAIKLNKKKRHKDNISFFDDDYGATCQ